MSLSSLLLLMFIPIFQSKENKRKYHVTSVTCNDAFQCSNQAQILTTNNHTDDTNILCNGYKSCLGVMNIVSHNNIMCGAVSSCSKVLNITSANEVYCGGFKSCSSTTIYSKYVTCSAEESCSKSIINSSYITCSAQDACREANIYTKYIIGDSYHSLTDSIIQTNDNSHQIEVKLFGYQSGRKSVLICDKNEKCNLQCSGSACDKFAMYCHEKAECNIIPNGCKYKKGGSEEGVICPDIISFNGDVPYLKTKINEGEMAERKPLNGQYDGATGVYNSNTLNHYVTIYVICSFSAGFLMAVLILLFLNRRNSRKSKEDYSRIV